MSAFTRYLLGLTTSLLTPQQRTTHTYVIGQPGTGKSRALESWALQDIEAGHGVAVVDPHGDLFQHLVAHLSSKPDTWERLVIMDATDRTWVTSFNPLEAMPGVSYERLAVFLTDVMMKIWRIDATEAPRLVWLLTNSFLALSSLGLTLLDLPRFLLDAEFREQLIPNIPHEQARAYFTYEYPKSQGAARQWATPLLNKIGGLIFDADLRLMVAGRSTVNFREVLDKQLILLVNIPKGIIGEAPSALLGAFIVAHLQKAALSRADTRTRQPYYLYLDEFQNYTTDNIRDILSESRKYALSLTLAHQYLDQLSPELRSAVLNTTGTLCCFRVGYHDAAQLAKDVFPSSEFLAERTHRVKLSHLWRVPLVTVKEEQDSLGWDGLAHLITNLPTRQFWTKRRETVVPARLRTLDMPDPVYNPERKKAIRDMRSAAGKHYGRLKVEVAREIAESRVFGERAERKEERKSSGDAKPSGNVSWWGK